MILTVQPANRQLSKLVDLEGWEQALSLEGRI